MDSPETTKLTSSSIASDSSPLQESPFSDFIKNLSPITHVKSTHNLVRGLSRLNSPPIVFKSPRTKHRDETSILARSESLQLSNLEASKSPVDLGKEYEAQKGCESDVIGSFETHPSSSSGCVDEFLASPRDVDCLNSAKSATLSVKKYRNSRELDQSCSSDSKRTLLQFDGSNGKWVDAFLFSSEQTKSDQGEAKLIEIEAELNDGKWSYGCLNTETSFQGGHGFAVQTCQISQAQGVQNEHQSDLDYDSQLSAQHFPVQTSEDNDEDVRGPSGRLVDDIARKGQKANETHRGVRRRCLQFEESPLRSIGPTDSSLNHGNKVNSLKRSNSSNVECNSTSETHISNLSQSNATLKHSRSSENITLALKPLGIGLHLNSIVSATSQSFTSTFGKKSADQCVGIGGLKSSMLENEDTRSMPLSVPVNESITIKETIGSTKDLISVSSVSDQFPHSVEDQSGAIDETGNSNPRNVDVLEEHDRTSPRKKRKKAMGNDGADGCKRCSCRKTKCLKLYCDCFAAGVYCTDPCDCQGCFNKLEYKDKVLETREQIESRNPLAFAPKIVQLASELPPDNGREDGNNSTPASARHKRGCNCKKSMCLKKYCECYQANVGCSSGCRCEGCKNVYGRKEEHVAIIYGVNREATRNSVCLDSEMVEISRDLQCAKSTDMHNLTPQTPSVQHSDHGKAVPKSRFLSERYHPSLDAEISASSSSYEKPTKSPPRNDKNNNGVGFERCELSQGEGYNKGRLCLPISSTRDSLSKELSDTRIPVVSINKQQNHQCSLRSDHLSSHYHTRHGSPLTPKTRLGGTEPRQCSDSGCEPVDILEDNETPVTVKVSSPNKKRVSPSMGHIYKLGSRSSGAPRNGRKFILKSVPSFPPLTPCIDSKGSSGSQDSNKLQDIN